MIKEVTNKQKETKEIGFPKLMIGSKDNVILATSISVEGITGMVVRKGQEKWPVGDYAANWSALSFTDYNEPITLQTETE